MLNTMSVLLLIIPFRKSSGSYRKRVGDKFEKHKVALDWVRLLVYPTQPCLAQSATSHLEDWPQIFELELPGVWFSDLHHAKHPLIYGPFPNVIKCFSLLGDCNRLSCWWHTKWLSCLQVSQAVFIFQPPALEVLENWFIFSFQHARVTFIFHLLACSPSWQFFLGVFKNMASSMNNVINCSLLRKQLGVAILYGKFSDVANSPHTGEKLEGFLDLDKKTLDLHGQAIGSWDFKSIIQKLNFNNYKTMIKHYKNTLKYVRHHFLLKMNCPRSMLGRLATSGYLLTAKWMQPQFHTQPVESQIAVQVVSHTADTLGAIFAFTFQTLWASVG